MAGNRRWALKLAAGTAVAAVCPWSAARAASEAPFKRLPKAVWAWHLDPRNADRFIRFAKAHGLGRLHLHIGREDRTALLTRKAEPLTSLKAIRSAGIELVALTGDPNWPKRQERIPRSLQDLIEIQETFGLFEALNLDIEPHTLPEWRVEARRRSLMDGMLQLLDRVRSRAPAFPIDATVPPRYASDRLADDRPLLAAICDRVQAASVMAFRDDPRKIVEWAGPALSALAAANTPWRLGILVHAAKEKNISYHGAGRDRFMGDMVAVDALVRNRPDLEGTYRGLIFEHLRGLTEIVR